MDAALFWQFRRLVAERTGLWLQDHTRPEAGRFCEERVRALGLPGLAEYFAVLARSAPPGRGEWPLLLARLTVGETYFFRDQGQIALLEERILPRLLAENQATRTLRIWSAGCASGEEAYTLAILVDRLLPDRAGWSILILGTDINAAALERAQRGLYGNWSFRGVEAAVRGRYFHPRGELWEIDPGIRTLVSFQHGNLLQDAFPARESALQSIDLIVCRNVFIYFEPAARSRVVAKLVRTLRPGGYLITGHAELAPAEVAGLTVESTGVGVVYRNAPGKPAVKPAPAPAPVPAPAPRRAAAPPVQPGGAAADLDEAERLFRTGAYAAAATAAQAVLAAAPGNYQAHLLLARALANRGDSDRAAAHLHEALAVQPLAVEPWLLLAHLAELQGDHEAAKEALKRVIYLAPGAPAAYLELAALYQRQHDHARARKLWSSALALLRSLPPQSVVETYEDRTARELVAEVENLIRPAGGASPAGPRL